MAEPEFGCSDKISVETLNIKIFLNMACLRTSVINPDCSNHAESFKLDHNLGFRLRWIKFTKGQACKSDRSLRTDGNSVREIAAHASAVLVFSILFVRISPVLGADQVHDEIQVYNAGIAAVGQWTYQQHLNYAAIGQTVPEVPGGFYSNRALQGTPEFAYGITPWWEAGFYLPFAVNGDSQFLSDGAKIRSLFVVPDAAKRSFFYGVNFELGYELPRFSSVPWNLEIRPIIGVRNKEWEFIVNPIVDVGFGHNGESDFAPAVRLARDLGEDRFIGLEYYADYGKIGSFLPFQQQNQQLFAVTDFKIGKVDMELGAGYGFTPGSDRFTIKAIIGYAFDAPSNSSANSSSPVPLKMGATPRALSNAWATNPGN